MVTARHAHGGGGSKTRPVRTTPRAGGRPTTIRSLATYVPPRLLTNTDLEKMVETTNEWILQRTGIRERHIVDSGVATSDLSRVAAVEAIERAGLTPEDIGVIIVGHGDPRHAFSEHGVSRSAQDRRTIRMGIRSERGVLRVHVLVDHGQPTGWPRGPMTTRWLSAPT